MTIDTSNSAGGTIDVGNSTNPRGMAKAINAYNSDITDWSIMPDTDWNIATDLNGDSSSEISKVAAAYDLIGRYMSSSFYHASDFETAFKGKYVMSNSNSTRNAEDFAEGLELTSDRDNYSEHDFSVCRCEGYYIFNKWSWRNKERLILVI